MQQQLTPNKPSFILWTKREQHYYYNIQKLAMMMIYEKLFILKSLVTIVSLLLSSLKLKSLVFKNQFACVCV